MNRTIKLIRNDRRSISIEINTNCEIIVRAPYKMKNSDIEKFIHSRSSWIESHLSEMRERISSENMTAFTDNELEKMKLSLPGKLNPRLTYYSKLIGVSYAKVSIRTMTSRWGSCTGTKNLCFNVLLDCVPEHILDYVVVHELCHLKEMNHSAMFWKLVEEQIPDYNECRAWLRDKGTSLIHRLKTK